MKYLLWRRKKQDKIHKYHLMAPVILLFDMFFFTIFKSNEKFQHHLKKNHNKIPYKEIFTINYCEMKQ